MKAVAECPEGKELREEPSGRITSAVFLIMFTALAINMAEKASETTILPQELRFSTPASFIPNVAAKGRYCK